MASRGYLARSAQSNLDSLGKRKFILYRIVKQERIKIIEGPDEYALRVFYVSQVTPFNADFLIDRHPAWNLVSEDYAIVNKDVVASRLVLYKDYMEGRKEGFPREQYGKVSKQVSDVYIGLLKKGWDNLRDSQHVEYMEQNLRNYLIEHKIRMKMRNSYRLVKSKGVDLERILAELKTIMKAEEPWFLLAKLFRATFLKEDRERYLSLLTRLSGSQDREDVYLWIKRMPDSGTIEDLKKAAEKAYDYFDEEWSEFYSIPSKAIRAGA